MDYQVCEDCRIELDLVEIQDALVDGKYLCSSCRAENGMEEDDVDVVFEADDWEKH